MTARSIADFQWRGGDLAPLSAPDHARDLAALFSSLEAGLETNDASAGGDAIEQSTWTAIISLAQAYGLFAKALRGCAESKRAPQDPLTASRLNELLLKISAAEARLMAALAGERSRWFLRFIEQ